MLVYITLLLKQACHSLILYHPSTVLHHHHHLHFMHMCWFWLGQSWFEATPHYSKQQNQKTATKEH